MTATKPDTVSIDPALQVRLSTLASRSGLSVDELAGRVLADHVENAERSSAEYAEDDARWQRYLESGTVVPAQAIRSKLRNYAAQAAAQPEPQ